MLLQLVIRAVDWRFVALLALRSVSSGQRLPLDPLDEFLVELEALAPATFIRTLTLVLENRLNYFEIEEVGVCPPLKTLLDLFLTFAHESQGHHVI